MSDSRSLRIAVENLGPIQSGTIELKPLTILIGPNNSGKSFFAQLVYALAKSFSDRLPLSPYAISDGTRDQANNDLFQFLLNTTGHTHEVHLSDLPPHIAAEVGSRFHQIENAVGPAVDGALLEYCTSGSISEIVRRDSAHRRPMSVTVNNNLLSISIDESGSTEYRCFVPRPAVLSVSRDDLDSPRHAGFAPAATDWCNFMAVKMWSSAKAANGLPARRTHYLPSYRSGLMQTLDIFVKFSLRLLTQPGIPDAFRIAGIRPRGILADYLSGLPFGEADQPSVILTPLQPALRFLEGDLLGGEIITHDLTSSPSVLLYRQGEHSYPLSMASSMVAELAPLDILLRKRIQPGDLLIIDEPEAHLHPENQRLIARVIARLVRAGVRVICPTHSSIFLHQISNHILASAAGVPDRELLDFTKDDVLDESEVGVFLFALTPDGSQVSRVPIEPGFGISEDEFLRVAESIGEESYVLTEALAQAPGQA